MHSLHPRTLILDILIALMTIVFVFKIVEFIVCLIFFDTIIVSLLVPDFLFSMYHVIVMPLIHWLYRKTLKKVKDEETKNRLIDLYKQVHTGIYILYNVSQIGIFIGSILCLICIDSTSPKRIAPIIGIITSFLILISSLIGVIVEKCKPIN